MPMPAVAVGRLGLQEGRNFFSMFHCPLFSYACVHRRTSSSYCAPQIREAFAEASEKTSEAYTAASEKAMMPVVEECRALLPLTAWKDLSPSLFVTFWSLSLYDLVTPAEAYVAAVKRLEDELKELERVVRPGQPKPKKKMSKSRLKGLIDSLKAEQLAQVCVHAYMLVLTLVCCRCVCVGGGGGMSA
jgi:hypothetical protein